MILSVPGGQVGEPLEDLDYFRQVRVDDDARTVVWPNGLDPAPELLHGGQESIDASSGNGRPRRALGIAHLRPKRVTLTRWPLRCESAWPSSTQRWEPGR